MRSHFKKSKRIDDPFKDDFDDISSQNSTSRGKFNADSKNKSRIIVDDQFEDSFVFVGDNGVNISHQQLKSTSNPTYQSPKTPSKQDNLPSISGQYNSNHIKPSSQYASSKKTGNFEIKTDEQSNNSHSTRKHPIKALAFEDSDSKRRDSLLSNSEPDRPADMPFLKNTIDKKKYPKTKATPSDNTQEYENDFEVFEDIDDNSSLEKIQISLPTKDPKKQQDHKHLGDNDKISSSFSRRQSNDSMTSPSYKTNNKDNSLPPKRKIEPLKSPQQKQQQHQPRLSVRSSSSTNSTPKSPFLPTFAASPSNNIGYNNIQKSPSSNQRPHRSLSKGSPAFTALSYVDKFAGILKQNGYDKMVETQIAEENRALQEKIYIIQTQLYSRSFSSKSKKSSSSKFFSIDSEIAHGDRLIASLQGEYKKQLQRESIVKEPSYMSKIRDEISGAEKVYQLFRGKVNAEQRHKMEFEKKLTKISQNKGVSNEARAAQELRIEINTIERKINDLKQQQFKLEETATKSKVSMEAKQKAMDEMVEKAKQQNVDTTVQFGRKMDRSNKRELQKQLREKVQTREKNLLQMEKQLRQKDDELRKELIQVKAQNKDADDDLWLQSKELDSQNRRIAAILQKAGIELIEKVDNINDEDKDDDFSDRDDEVIFHERYIIKLNRKVQIQDKRKDDDDDDERTPIKNSFLTEVNPQPEKVKEQNNHQNQHHIPPLQKKEIEEVVKQQQEQEQNVSNKPLFNFRRKDSTQNQQQPKPDQQQHQPSPSQDIKSTLKQIQYTPSFQSPLHSPSPVVAQAAAPVSEPIQYQKQPIDNTPTPPSQQNNNKQTDNHDKLQYQQKSEHKTESNDVDLNLPFRGVRRNRGGISSSDYQQNNIGINASSSYMPSIFLSGNTTTQQNNTTAAVVPMTENKLQQQSSKTPDSIPDTKPLQPTPHQEQKNLFGVGLNSPESNYISQQKTFNFGGRRPAAKEEEKVIPPTQQHAAVENKIVPPAVEKPAPAPTASSTLQFLGPNDKKRIVVKAPQKQHKQNGFSLDNQDDNQQSFSVKDISEIGTQDIQITTKKPISQAGGIKEEHLDDAESGDDLDFLKSNSSSKPNYDDDDFFGAPAKNKKTTLISSKDPPHQQQQQQQPATSISKTNALAQMANKTDLMSEFDF